MVVSLDRFNVMMKAKSSVGDRRCFATGCPEFIYRIHHGGSGLPKVGRRRRVCAVRRQHFCIVDSPITLQHKILPNMSSSSSNVSNGSCAISSYRLHRKQHRADKQFRAPALQVS